MTTPYSGHCIRCDEWVYPYEGGADGQCYYCGQINYVAYFEPQPAPKEDGDGL